MIRNKRNKKSINNLAGLFLIGLILIIVFFWGGSASLLKQNIPNWPKARAEVTSVKSKIVCETPERSSACYTLFFIEYSYTVNAKKYMSQMEQMYGTNYSPGSTFDVYYKKDNPQLVFPKGKIPTRLDFYLPLISGSAILIFVIILWIWKNGTRGTVVNAH